MKKGVVDVQFNWIFVLIAGSVLFLFIITLVLSQQRNAEKQLSLEVLRTLTTAIRGKQQLSNAYSEIIIPKSQITFQCDKETGIAYLGLEGAPNRQVLGTEIIFAPPSITNTKISVWTQDFSVPFTATRFIYITSQNNPIVLYYNDTVLERGLANMIYADLPGNVTKFKTNDSGVVTTILNRFRDSRVTVVCFGVCPAGTPYVKIMPNEPNNFDVSGNITFFDGSSITTTNYITRSGIYAAIFSGNNDTYNCEMNRAFEQLNIKRAIMENKIFLLNQSMEATYHNSSKCVTSHMYALPLAHLARLNNPGFSNLANTTYYARQIFLDNQELQLLSCPLIY